MTPELVKARSILSASVMHRRRICPGSAWAEFGQPETESANAALGTLLHAADADDEELEDIPLEELLKRNRDLRDKYVAQTLEERGIPADARRKIIKDTVRYTFTAADGQPLLGIDGKPLSGQPDYIALFLDYSLLLVGDNKFGRIPVAPAERNYQIRTNVVLVHQELDADTVLGFITQPLAYPNFHAVEYDRAAIAASTAELVEIALNTMSPDAPRYASYPACQYCKAKPSCKVGQALTQGLIQVRLAEIPIPELEAISEKMDIAAEVVKAYWERMEFIATNYPALLPNWTMKPGSPTRSIEPVNYHNALRLLEQAGVVGESDIREVSKIGIGKIENLCAKRLGVPKKAAKEKLEEILGPTLSKKPKKSSIVKVSETKELKP